MIDLDAELAKLERAWNASRQQNYQPVVGALHWCHTFSRRLPHWAFSAIQHLLIKQLPRESIHDVRWQVVRDLLAEPRERWEDVWRHAATMLEGTDAAGSGEVDGSIRKSFELIDRGLQEERYVRPKGPRK